MPLYPLVLIALPAAAHLGVVGAAPAPGVLLLLLLIAAGAFTAGRRGARVPLVGYGLAAAAILAAVAVGGERYLFYAVPQVVTLLLAGLFAASLAPGHTPLVTRFATAVDGELPDDLRRYTRHATTAWALFLGLLHAEGWLLLAAASPATWSLFANGLNYGFIGLFFVLEFHVRRRLLPHRERRGLLAFLAALARADLRRAMAG